MTASYSLLGIREGEAGVDLEGLAGLMPRVRLDQGVVDSLGLQPGEEEVDDCGVLQARRLDVAKMVCLCAAS